MRWSAKTALWTPYWRGRHARWHRYDLLDRSPETGSWLDKVDGEPTGILWG